MCIDASVKRAPHLVADGRVDVLSEEVIMKVTACLVDNDSPTVMSSDQECVAEMMKLWLEYKYACYGSINVCLTPKLYKRTLTIYQSVTQVP
jgi:hypothetical protein